RPGSATGPLSWVAHGIDAADGTRLVDALLASAGPPVVTVSSLPVSALIESVSATYAATDRPRRGRAQASGQQLRDEYERQLADLWEGLLGVEGIRSDDDFFELGGHSLIAVRLANQIEKRFGARLKLATLFEARTLRD